MDFLYNCLWTEARGESLKGQIFVLNTIQNRVDDIRWPSTIEAVITQPYQFSISSQTTDISDLKLLCKLCRLNYLPKLTSATHFHTIFILPYWSSSLEYLETVGRHKFYK